MSVGYDPNVIEKYSASMYQSADRTATMFPVVGVLLGVAVGANLLNYGLLKAIGAVVGGGAGGYLGYRYDITKSMALRSQAQSALCLAEIERNTRSASPEGRSKGAGRRP